MYYAMRKKREKILVFLTHHTALPVLKLVRKPNPFPWRFEELQQMPEGTVGRDLAAFITRKDIQLLANYERHDMKHFLLGFDTTEAGEICMQCFMLGNGRVSFPVMITVAFGILFTPEYWKNMRYFYTCGKAHAAVHNINWFALIPLQTKDVQKQFGLPVQTH